MNAVVPAGRAMARIASGLNDTVPAAARARGPGPVLAFIDRGPEAANAAWRAALVARDRGLALHLVAMQTLHANLAEAAGTASSQAAELRRRLDLDVVAHALAGTRDHEGVEVARQASLIVLPPSPPGLRWPFGSPVLRMLRRCGRPVLLVRRPAKASYRSVLAAVELELDACSLISAGRALSRDPRMKVLHVLDTAHEEAMRLADLPARALQERRERDAASARRVLAELIASAGARDDAHPVISFGPVRDALLGRQVASNVDLMVLGKRPRPPLADALFGGVTQAVLRHARADVLVLPMAPRAAAPSWQRPEFAGATGR